MKAFGSEAPNLMAFFLEGNVDFLTKTVLQVSLGSSAWVLLLLFGLRVASLAIMLERGWVFYRTRCAEEPFVTKLDALLRQGHWTQATSLCRESRALEPQVPLAVSWKASRPTKDRRVVPVEAVTLSKICPEPAGGGGQPAAPPRPRKP